MRMAIASHIWNNIMQLTIASSWTNIIISLLAIIKYSSSYLIAGIDRKIYMASRIFTL